MNEEPRGEPKGSRGPVGFISDTLRNRDIHDYEWWYKFGRLLVYSLVPAFFLGAVVFGFPPLAWASFAIGFIIAVALFVALVVKWAIELGGDRRQRRAR
jgi:hypothetical protein